MKGLVALVLGLVGTVTSPTLADDANVFGSDWLRDLPSSGSIWSLVETVDARTIVDRIDNGGLFPAEPAVTSAHGASWTQTAYRLGALDVTDPERTGTPLLLLDPSLLERLEIRSGLAPVEDRGAGLTLHLTPVRPRQEWHGAFQLDAIPAGWQPAFSGTPAISRYESSKRASGLVEGPLMKDRASFALAATFVRGGRFERADSRAAKSRLGSVFTRVACTPTPNDDVDFIAVAQDVRHPATAWARLGAAPETDRFFHLQAAWTQKRDAGWSAAAGYSRGSFDPGPRRVDAVVERLLDGSVPSLVAGASRRQRFEFVGDRRLAARTFAGGTHAFRFGASLARHESTTRPVDAPTVLGETVNGLGARAWAYGWPGPQSRRSGTAMALHAADSVTAGRLTAEGGLRFEHQTASADGAPQGIAWNSLSPRVRARLRIANPLTLFAGYARYGSRLPLGLAAFGEPAAPQGDAFRWNDANADGVVQQREVGPLVVRAGPGGAYSSVDPSLRGPHTDEVVAGVEGRFDAWVLGFRGVHRRERDLVASVNVGVPARAYDVSSVPDPSGDLLGPADDQLLPIYDRTASSFAQDRYVLLNSASESVLHEGVEIALDGAIGKRLRLRLGATASRSVGPGGNRGFHAIENDPGVVGERLEQPNATTFSSGRLFFDRAYTIKIALAYRARGDLRFGLATRYQDGQPFARVVLAEDARQGVDFVQAIPNGRGRFTYTLTMDARLEKSFGRGRYRPAVVAEAFNLLDKRNEVEEDIVTGPTYRRVTVVQPPRAVRLGLRLDF